MPFTLFNNLYQQKKAKLKYIMGKLSAQLFPTRTKHLKKTFSVPNFTTASPFQHRIDTMIHHYLVQHKINQEQTEHGSMENAHRQYWSQNRSYFSDFDHLAQDSYIPVYQDIVHNLVPYLQDMEIRRVNEFGTGDGQWLDYLSQQWPFITQFTGIDISDYQIQQNRLAFSHLEFATADLLTWTQQNATPQTLYHTNGGVLEYLCEDSVRALFTTLKQQAPRSLIFLNEPVYDNFDYAVDTNSRIAGAEFTYNHNYDYLFAATELTMIRCEERNAFGYRVITAIGRT